jgi:4-hydroxy-tetrahydrodipicolinate synthase
VINRPFHGVVPAMVTPFKDNERIDYSAWQVLIDLLIASGVHGLYAVGPPGEFYALDMEERTVAMRFCKQAIQKRVPLYVNVGCITTRDTVALALQGQALDVDALVVVTPYFVKLSQQELLDHYVEVCRAVRMPVMHAGSEIEPSTVAQIAAQCPNFTGAEEFSAAANVAPRLFVELDQAADPRLQGLADSLDAVPMSPAVIKEALGLLGVPVGRCRKPVASISAESRRRLTTALEQLKAAGLLPGVTHGARA